LPQAPGLVPTAQPSLTGTPEVSLPVPVDAFGGAIGHAIQSFGTDLTHATNEIWQQVVANKNLQNETEAKNADAQYMMQAGIKNEEFKQREGLNAGPDALAKHITDLNDLRTSLRGSLNPAAARMYDGSSLSNMGSYIRLASGYSGTQMKVANNNAATSRKEIIKNNIEADPNDEVTFHRGTQALRGENSRLADNGGWSPDQLEATNQSDVSDYWSKRIASLSKTDAIGAQKMLDTATKNKAITPTDAGRVTATVQQQFDTQGSRVITNKVLADRRAGEEEADKPVDTYIDAGMKEADKLGLDPARLEEFKDRVRTSIMTKYKQQKSIETDSDNQNVRTIGKALIKANAEGQSPTTLEELKGIDPAVSPAWDAISRDPRKQQAILKQLEHNAAGTNRIPTTQANLMLFHQYKGMSLSPDDDKRASFMAQNFGADNRLSLPQRDHLMNIQERMQKNQYDDPRVVRALRILAPDMRGADVKYPIDPKKDPQNYFQFVGGLADSLEQYKTDHPGKMPSPDEVKQIGSQLMQEQASHWWQSHEAFYQMQAGTDDQNRIRALPFWKGITPDEGKINRYYRAELYQQKYGGSASRSSSKVPDQP